MVTTEYIQVPGFTSLFKIDEVLTAATIYVCTDHHLDDFTRKLHTAFTLYTDYPEISDPITMATAGAIVIKRRMM